MKRKLKGIVVSDKMNKTRVVEVTRLKKHPRYFKYTEVRAKFKAHDEINECKMGDEVIIEETKPISKDKRWQVASIVKKASRKIEGDGESMEENNE